MIIELLAWLGLMPSALPSCLFPDDGLTTPLLTPDLTNLTTTFSFDLLLKLDSVAGQAGGGGGNLLLSPYSLWSGLLLAYLGAGGTTEQELREVLGLVDKSSGLALYKSLYSHHSDLWTEHTTRYRLSVVNRLYVDDNTTVRYCANKMVAPGIQQVDFGDVNEAAKTINRHVKQATEMKIKRLVKSRDVRNASVVLMNAAYFNGYWATPLNTVNTSRKQFWVDQTNFKMVDTVTITGHFWTGNSSDLQARVLEMPLAGSQPASMMVFLPTENATISTLLGQLTAESLNSAIRGTFYSEVVVSIPKLKMGLTLKSNLRRVLTQMGIRDLFSTSANLTRYFPDAGVHVTGGVHKAVIEVNAADADTAPVIPRRLLYPYQEAPPFVCDKPFVFLLRDNQDNSILFVGVYRQPES